MSDRLAELEAFVRVVDHGTLSAAARALDCSPSAMSKLVQRLENRLGVRLVNRTSRALSLTPEGELFYQEAQRALEAVTRAEQAVAARSSEVTGVLRVGTSIQIAQFYLAPLVPALRELHPKLDLHFVLKALPFPLVENQIDVAVFSGEQPRSSYVARRIAPVRWIVCAAPSYLQQHGSPQHPSDLARHDCLTYLPGADLTWPFRVDGQPFAVSPTGRICANSGALLRTFAVLGLGIARVPIAHVRGELQGGALVPLLEAYEEPTPEWLYAVYHSARNLSPRAIAFLKVLDSSFRQPLPAG